MEVARKESTAADNIRRFLFNSIILSRRHFENANEIRLAPPPLFFFPRLVNNNNIRILLPGVLTCDGTICITIYRICTMAMEGSAPSPPERPSERSVLLRSSWSSALFFPLLPLAITVMITTTTANRKNLQQREIRQELTKSRNVGEADGSALCDSAAALSLPRMRLSPLPPSGESAFAPREGANRSKSGASSAETISFQGRPWQGGAYAPLD